MFICRGAGSRVKTAHLHLGVGPQYPLMSCFSGQVSVQGGSSCPVQRSQSARGGRKSSPRLARLAAWQGRAFRYLIFWRVFCNLCRGDICASGDPGAGCPSLTFSRFHRLPSIRALGLKGRNPKSSSFWCFSGFVLIVEVGGGLSYIIYSVMFRGQQILESQGHADCKVIFIVSSLFSFKLLLPHCKIRCFQHLENYTRILLTI